MKYELSSNFKSEISDIWKTIANSSDCIYAKDLKVALLCVGYNIKDEELLRIKKEKNLLEKEVIEFNEFLDIIKFKSKSRDISKEMDYTLRAFKENKEGKYSENDLKLINPVQKNTLSTISSLDQNDGVNPEEILDFCNSMSINTTKQEVTEMVRLLCSDMQITKTDLNYLYKKTNFI